MEIKTIRDDQMTLPTGAIITFNDEQYDGIRKINDWLTTKENTFFVLSGYAGTGKTTIIKKILDDYIGGVVVSAPTHKAKKVIAKLTGVAGQTLHSLLGLRPDVNLDDFNPNDPKFNPIAIPKISDFNFVIIDEASMINLDLFNLIKKKTKNTRTKVLFVGDPAQIPPVGEKESVVFLEEKIPRHHLTKIERQNLGNPISLIYTNIRNNLNEFDCGIERKTNINEKDEGIEFIINKKEFRKKLLEKFSSEEFKEDIDYCRLIVWKNHTVMMSNKIIRYYIFNKPKEIILKNDLLMGYRSIISANLRFNIIENSVDYKVVHRSKLKKNKDGILGYETILREYTTNDYFKDVNVFIVDSTNKDNINLYAGHHDNLKNKAIKDKKLWKKYYAFRRNNLIMVDIEKHKNGEFRNKKDIIRKDIDYAYAITAHKSQGSTYEHVFVMENDINDNWLIKERNQIKYVALTRPIKSATVLTNKIDY
jgi:ATP-dependent exoDNAse (exonuclease V) alpha subunit